MGTAWRLGKCLPLLLIVVFVVSGVLRAIFGRLFGSVATGGLTAGIVWLLSHVIPIGIGAGVLAFLFALLTGGSRSGLVDRPRAGAAAWEVLAADSGGGGFGGGGGGGGFSGGGGGFSGGGASGSW